MNSPYGKCFTRYGMMNTNMHDNTIGKSLRLYGEWAELEMELIRLFMKPNMLVLDIGANIGTHTVAMGKMLNNTGRIYAFEPQNRTAQLLCANITEAELTNCEVVIAAVGAELGYVDSDNQDYASDGNQGAAKVYPHMVAKEYPVMASSPARQTTRMVTVDSLRLPACHFIKADVEGMELAVLNGAFETIKAHKPIMYLEYNSAERQTVVERVKSHGYNVWEHVAPAFNPNNFSNNPEDIFGGYIEHNILCLPKEMQLQTNMVQL